MNMIIHPNILKAYRINFNYEKNPPSILLEYCIMNLDTVIKEKRFSNVQLSTTIYQIVEGMKYLHFNKIIHCDLKPSNILIAPDGTIKISDFKSSKLLTQDNSNINIVVGTNKFMAPEIIAEEDQYDEKVDVYSFCVLVYFIVSGGELPNIKIGEILKGKKAEIPSSFTEATREIINSCWNFNSNERPSFNEICERMKTYDYNLIDMTHSENQEVKKFVENYQKRIPNY